MCVCVCNRGWQIAVLPERTVSHSHFFFLLLDLTEEQLNWG